MAHDAGEVPPRSPKTEVVVRPEEAVGVDFHPPPGLRLCQALQEALVVAGPTEDVLAAKPPIQYVIDCAGILDAEGTRHAGRL
jgi:hypothetical protein